MDKIIMILGSSAFSMIITLVFNWAQNRKNDSLSYITEERKVWREKIREISSKIEQYTYQEKDKMGQELVQLQMNINPYGKASATDCIHDGHIWSVIQQIKNSQNSKEFEENKQLLLDYLALMLKDDWERSKEEVRGYSKLAVYMVIVGILFALYAILYFYIFKLENYTWFLLVVLINILVLVLTKYYFVDKVKKIYKDRNSLAIKKVLKKEKMDKKVCLLYAMTIILAVSFNVFIVKYVCPQMMVEKIECFKSTDNIYICTELDEKLWAGLKTGLENNIGGDVIWLQEKEKILDSEEMIIPIDSNIVIDIIINNMTLWGFVVEMWVMLLFITELYFLRMSNKKEKFIDEVERLKYDTYEENYKDVIGILERIDLNTENKKENEEYLGVLHRIFCELEKKLMREIDEKEKYMMSIKEYDEVKELKEKQKVIKDTIEQIKDMAKAKKIQNQKEIMQKVTMNVKELSKNSNI